MKSRILVILSVLSFLLAGLAATSAEAANSSVTVSVPAIQPWVDTGVFINIGDSVSITATGTIYAGASDLGKTPAGTPSCVATADNSMKPGPFLGPGLTCWSLIGRVGNSPAFEVGTGTSFIAISSGELNLSVDDNYFPDNRGAWTATITR
jgi:hypothetical protein